jgi:hypothetical protein
MSEPEPSVEPEGTETGHGLGSFLNSAPRIIGAISGLIAAVTGLLIALNKTGIIGGNGEDGPRTTPTETVEAAGLFEPLRRPPLGRVYFDGPTMYVRASLPSQPFVHLATQERALGDVSMTSRVTWVSGARDYGVGFICRYERAGSYYLLAVLSGPRYNIVRYRNGRPTSLSGGIRPTAAVREGENALTAKCVGDEPTILTLQANGQPVGRATDDDGIESGNVGVRVGSGESFVTLRFDEFVLNYL